MNQRYKSIAQWPEGTCGSLSDRTEDVHESQDEAKAVCNRLERGGFANEGEVFPIRTWVEPVPELIPCPFCGGDNVLIAHPYSGNPVRYVPICTPAENHPGCGASGTWCDTREEAIEKWNTRTVFGSLDDRGVLVTLAHHRAEVAHWTDIASGTVEKNKELIQRVLGLEYLILSLDGILPDEDELKDMAKSRDMYRAAYTDFRTKHELKLPQMP